MNLKKSLEYLFYSIDSNFFIFRCLYHPVVFNESKEKFRIVFYCCAAIENIIISSFLTFFKFYCEIKLLGKLVFACLDKSMPIRL